MKNLRYTGLLLVVLSLGSLISLPAAAQSGALWGISLNGFSNGSWGPSSLYVIDPITGAGTLIGTDLGYSVNSIAIDPTTGFMYASTTTWNESGGDFNGLLRIDTSAGTATEVGAYSGIPSIRAIVGITFDSSGQLWGWHDPSDDDPVLIDKASGVLTTVGNSGISTGGHVLAFDATDTLWLLQGDDVYIIDQVTGAAVSQSDLSFDAGSGGAAFNFADGLLWTSRENGGTQDAFLRVIDIAGDSFTDIDTDVEYLNGVTIGGTFTGAGGSRAAPIPVMSLWQLGLLSLLLGGGALGALRSRKRP